MYKNINWFTAEVMESGRAIVIWGTLTAGKLAYRLCGSLGVKVSAFGDNNAEKWGMSYKSVPICSPDQITAQYPDAMIFIGSVNEKVENAVESQLGKLSGRFTFVHFSTIEYLYEKFVLRRETNCPEKIYSIFQNIMYPKETPWRYELDRTVIEEYRYNACGNDYSLLDDIVSKNFKIKRLYILVNKNIHTDKLIVAIQELKKKDHIGHIILACGRDCELRDAELGILNGLVFYFILDSNNKYLSDKFNRLECVYEIRQFADEVFEPIKADSEAVTEQKMVEAVYRYLGSEIPEQRRSVLSTKKIFIVQIFNGLANQMLMYLFGRFLEKHSDRIVIFDDSVLSLDIYDKEFNYNRINKWVKGSIESLDTIIRETRERSSFYLFSRPEVAEVFDIPIRVLSDYFDKQEWMQYLYKVKKEFAAQYSQAYPLGQMLQNSGFNVDVIEDSLTPYDFVKAVNSFRFDTHILKQEYKEKDAAQFIVSYDRNAYFMGIWTSGEIKDWLYSDRHFVSETFRFNSRLDDSNLQYKKWIESTYSVILHIRRGDFLYSYMNTDTDYLKTAVNKVWMENPEAVFFVFSDDLEWCRNNVEKLGLADKNVKYVSANRGKHNYLDLYLMSLGKVYILTPLSTFGYMSLLLSPNAEKCADATKYFYQKKYLDKTEIEFVDIEE